MTFNPGDRVRLTGKFLRNTGQVKGREAVACWTVQTCSCAQGMCGNPTYTLTNQSADTSYYTVDELKEQPCLYWRRIASSNLEKVPGTA